MTDVKACANRKERSFYDAVLITQFIFIFQEGRGGKMCQWASCVTPQPSKLQFLSFDII